MHFPKDFADISVHLLTSLVDRQMFFHFIGKKAVTGGADTVGR